MGLKIELRAPILSLKYLRERINLGDDIRRSSVTDQAFAWFADASMYLVKSTDDFLAD